MILKNAYTTSDGGEQAPCPFCGSHDTSWHPGGKYSYDRVYCDACCTEFTFYPPEGKHRIGGPKLNETMGRWDERPETDNEHCPFCGGEPEYDGIMNSTYLFVDAYCPTCRVYYQFQKFPTVKTAAGNLRKAKRAFGRRAK